MDDRKAVWLAWVVAVVVVAGAAFGFLQSLGELLAGGNPAAVANSLLDALFTVAFGGVGAVILARQPGNRIGRLLALAGVALAIGGTIQDYLGKSAGGGVNPDLATYLFLWMSGWSWWLLVGPLFLLLLIFPSGRLLSPRWRWVAAMIGLLFITFLVIVTGQPEWHDPNSGWAIPNPLGAPLGDFSFDMISVPWGLALVVTLALCVISVLLRYRRAGLVEREQLKWFFFACAVLLVMYIVGVYEELGGGGNPSSLLFSGAILFVPISIGIAILRYHLFDIDLIIRRTLTYTVLTAIIAFLYFGSVIVLQQIFVGIIGHGSDAAIILSTLGIAGLFNPLRQQVQRAINRRFYRRKYDSAKVIASFGATARDEVDLNNLTGELLRIVQETMQPKSVGVWLMQREDQPAKQRTAR